MKRTGSVISIFGALALFSCLVGCDGCKQEPTGGDGTTRAGLEVSVDPASFRLIPADTPYVFASFQPIPREVVAAYIAMFAPAFDQSLATLKASLSRELDAAPGGDGGDPKVVTGQKVLGALLGELEGNFSEEGMARLGLSTQPQFAIYGLGLAPAFRLELKDVAAFESMLDRVLAKAGVKLPRQQLGDQQYWAVAVDDLTLVLATIGKELVGTLAPSEALLEVLPLLFGQQKPERSLADSGELRNVLADHGFLPYAVGYANLRSLAATLLGEGKGLDARTFAALKLDLPPQSPECKSEIRQLVDLVPRLVIGYEELSSKALAMVMVLQSRPELVKEIAALRTQVPGLGTPPAGSPLLSLGVGLDVQKMMDLLKAKALAIQAAPYKCEHLGELNSSAQELASTLQQPRIPPFVTSLKGFNVIVHQADLAGGMADGKVQAVGVIVAENPMMLLSMAQGLVPDLAKLKVSPDGTPVALPPLRAFPSLEEVFVATTGSYLALSIGKGRSTEMAGMLEQKPGASQPLLAATYDTPAMMDKMGKVTAGLTANLPPEARVEMERSMAMNEAVGKLFGLTTYALEVSDKGFLIKQRVELK